MFDPLAMIIADHAARQHVLYDRPTAQTTHDRPPGRGGHSIRRLTSSPLRRLADRIARSTRRAVSMLGRGF